MSGEERSGVTVGPDAEEDEVEDRETSRVFLSELADELFLVSVGKFFEVVEKGSVDGVNVFGWDGGVAVELFLSKAVVGVFVIEGNATFVGIEDLPAVGMELHKTR